MTPSTSLTSTALRGVGWTWAGSAVTLVLQLVYTAVMARLLDPAEFGLIAGALIGLRLISYFARFGVGNAVVQRDVLDELDVRVALTLSVLLGAAAGVVAVAAAPVLAAIIDQPETTTIMRWLAVGLVASGFAAVPEALLRRALRFRALAIGGAASFTIGYLFVGIGTALRGWGVWSLVAATLTQGIVLAAVVVVLVRPTFRPSLNRARARRILAFGGAVSLTGFLEAIGQSLDTLAVGRWAGASALGQYTRASHLVGLPVEQLTAAASRVLLPSLSRVQHEPDRFARGLLASISVLACLVMVLVAAGAAASPALVALVLGPGWDQAAAVLPVVGAAYGFGFLTQVPALAAEARGAIGTKLAVQGVTVLVLVTLLAIAATAGPTLHRIALAWLITEAVRHGLYWVVMRNVLDLELERVLRRYAFAAALAMSTAGPLVILVRMTTMSPVPAVIAGSATGAVLSAFIYWLNPSAAVRTDVEHLWRARFASAQS